MQHKTKGIVLNFIKYRETSIIVKIFTEQFGVQTYIENGIRSSRSKNKIALFQPLTLLDLVVYHDQKKDLHRLSEIRCSYPFKTIPFQINKSSIALFLNEILGKCLKEEAENTVLFEFIYHSLIAFDELEENYENFHLIFMLQLSFYLGFSPSNAKEIVTHFKETNIGIHFEEKLQNDIDSLISATYDSKLNINRFSRNHLLEIIIIFYRLHIEGIGDIKSLDVLREVMR